MLQHEAKAMQPPIEDWSYYEGTPTPGYFFARDLNFIRRKLLESGRSPKVTLQNGSQVIGLSYMCTEGKDQCKGLCVIKQEIEHEDQIRQWLDRLPRPVSWNAERLPAMTQKVLFELLRRC